MEEEEKEPFLVRMKYYATLTFGLTACLSSFIFMFMVPFVLDPSISTLMANFDPDPVVCKTVFTDHRYGMKNCSWSSCKHGCTTDQFDCDIIYVNYMLTYYKEYEGMEDENDEKQWHVRGIPVFINIKACGYPPETNCSIFADTYGPVGSVFPCYYSRVDSNLVITEYTWEDAFNPLIMAIIVPNLLTGVSLGMLSYWWYPGCQKRRCQYQLPPDQEDASSNPNDDEEGDDEEKKSIEDEDGKKKSDLEDNSSEDRRSIVDGGKKSRNSEEEKDKDTTIVMPEE